MLIKCEKICPLVNGGNVEIPLRTLNSDDEIIIRVQNLMGGELHVPQGSISTCDLVEELMQIKDSSVAFYVDGCRRVCGLRRHFMAKRVVKM